MNPEKVVLDTNVLIRRGFLDDLAERGWLSSVVLQEFAAGARDDAELRALATVSRATHKRGSLLVPDGDDWYQAGKVLSLLLRGGRSHRAGRTYAIDKAEQQRLVRDVLIARSAKRVNAAVVTYNRRDFEKIQRFCNVSVLEPEDFS